MYCSVAALDNDLCQGDILLPTEKLRAVLREVHPHFCNDKYTAFIVTTQTCDLVRRNGVECKSRYVNVSAVRPLEDVLWALLDKNCKQVLLGGQQIPGMYLEESRYPARRLVERILNQNEQGQGIFYLESDSSAGIADPSVALLQVSVALRAREHYLTVCEARRGRLDAEFRARLGWLIGNLYSRVAVEDMSPERLRELTDRLLPKESSEQWAPMWVPRQEVEGAQRASANVAGLSREEVARILRDFAPRAPKEVAIERVQWVVQQVLGRVADDALRKISTHLENDDVFSSVVRRRRPEARDDA